MEVNVVASVRVGEFVFGLPEDTKKQSGLMQ
jgi:hypothetical protein